MMHMNTLGDDNSRYWADFWDETTRPAKDRGPM